MNKNKYLIGLIGLALGFIISFFWTQSFNKTNATPGAAASGMPGSSAGGAGGPQAQQAMMGQVQQVLEKAKNNPNDFQAQIEAAKVFNQVSRDDETMEYLKKAYDIDAREFVRQSSGELQGVLQFMALYYEKKKNYEESDKWIRRALDASPTDNDLRVEFASTYLQRQPPQPDKAIPDLLAGIKANPKDGHALGHLVEAYALKKDVRGAEETLKRLRETDPVNKRISDLETVVADLKAGRAVTIPKE